MGYIAFPLHVLVLSSLRETSTLPPFPLHFSTWCLQALTSLVTSPTGIGCLALSRYSLKIRISSWECTRCPICL
ncbi:hypothetical protein BCR39DRAFT_552846 [Naematelia encephala]|uniref:Uncharacterized protein n=1 Tax=Naematelia encephala TaxID=71784 RepID=A0A1Y2AIN0_9TREE|nr:hypothetical protein BCR39DRAFT_552846 [Naematelia encephala]